MEQDGKEENKKKRKFVIRGKLLVPEHFSDQDLMAALNHSPSFATALLHSFPLVCGLIMKLRSGLERIYLRCECKFPRSPSNKPCPEQLYELVALFTCDQDSLQRDWTADTLWLVSDTLTAKKFNLSVPLQRDLINHPLYPFDPTTGFLSFHQDFLLKVQAYHDSVRRPEGTFTLPPHIEEQCRQLTALPREKCLPCDSLRHIYCGLCHGRRMSNAEHLLPARISLPFDITLVLHHNESLVKCTGIHTAVLALQSQVHILHWNKAPEDWKKIVLEEFDVERDVILFPSKESVFADEFDWSSTIATTASSTNTDNHTNTSTVQRKRLLVLEASWQYAKTMMTLIIETRKEHNLPPMPMVQLKDITGEYWRFQEVGSSAVSTIEAIAHAYKMSGVPEEEVAKLLLLFRLQKYRVLNKEEGKKIPRAIEVEGTGIGSWKDVIGVLPKVMSRGLPTSEKSKEDENDGGQEEEEDQQAMKR